MKKNLISLSLLLFCELSSVARGASLLPVAAATQAVEVVGHPDEWKDDQVHSFFSGEGLYSIVDVNDRFIIKSAKQGKATVVSIGILDGARKMYGGCVSAKKIEPGEGHTTWIGIAYTRSADGKSIAVTLTRTLDLFFHDRSYSFVYLGGNAVAHLDPGVSVEIDKNILIYRQNEGPIGASGNTKSLDIRYVLSGDYKELRSAVTMNTSSWLVSTEKKRECAACI